MDTNMIDALKYEYSQALANCSSTLFRHPACSMADQLKAIIPLAEQYNESDTYGQGVVVNDFENEVAALLGQPAALFLPSGTMAQLIALRIWAEQKHINTVAFHPTSHLQLHEQHAYSHLHGLQSCLVGQPDDAICVDDLSKIDQPIAALLLELPMREIGGQLPSWQELLKQHSWAKDNNVALHLDGARLWSCTEHYHKSLAEIGCLFDSVYVSFYKDLDGIAGAMLAGSEEFIAAARVWARRAGGNLITMFPLVLAAKQGLAENLPLMPQFVRKANTIAAYFNQHSSTKTIPIQPPTNLFHVVIEQPASLLMPKLIQWTQQNNIALLPQPRTIEDGLCRFEITIGKNALKLSDKQWNSAIQNFAASIA